MGAFAIALFFCIIFGSYAYAFYFGSYFVDNDVYNDSMKRIYTSGDVITIFFGVFFGMFSLGMAMPNFKAVTEGLIAGKMAYDIIDRVPKIPIEGKDDITFDLKGEIEFQDVDFTYPTRRD